MNTRFDELLKIVAAGGSTQLISNVFSVEQIQTTRELQVARSIHILQKEQQRIDQRY